MTENIHFSETAKEIAALHNWDCNKASFCGFALVKNADGFLEAVCLLVSPDGCRYHRMDGSEVSLNTVPEYEVIDTSHNRRVFSTGRLMVVINAKTEDAIFWEISSCGGVPDCYKEKYAALKAEGKL